MPDFSGLKVVVCGDVMVDRYIWGAVSRVSPEAPVQVVRAGETTSIPGGAGNVAANLAGLGLTAVLVGVRGKDESGRLLGELLDASAIAHKLVYAPFRPTTTKTRIMGHNQQLLRVDDESDEPLPPEIEETVFENFAKAAEGAGAVVLSDYGKGLFSGRLAARIIAHCAESGVPALVDPKGRDWGRYTGAYCVTPNQGEFLQATGLGPEEDEEAMAAKAVELIDSLKLSHLLVTRGALGMTLYTPGRPPETIPTRAVEVFDVSGAGDTVIATVAASLAAGLELGRAASLANAAAGIVVGKVGTKPVSASELRRSLSLESGAAAKIQPLGQAVDTVRAWRASGKTVVFTNGCFDLLHVGHIGLLNESAALGGRLVVGLNTDASVRRLKGPERPIIPENERASLLAALECVDMVVLFDEDTPLTLIEALKPDILVKGGDYTRETVVGHELVEKQGGRVHIVPLSQGKSTSLLIEKLRSGNAT